MLFCQAVIMDHVLDVQIFKGHEPESINQAATDLMGEFVSLVSYSLMNSSLPAQNSEELKNK